MINRKIFCFFILTMIFLYNYIYASSKSENSVIKLAIYDYKFTLLEVIEVDSVFNEIDNVILEDNNYKIKNLFLKNNLKYDNEYYYILVAKNDLEIENTSRTFNEIEILYESDYYSYCKINPVSCYYDYQIELASNDYLFNNISLPKEILPDGHWLLFENSQDKHGLLMEFIIKEKLLNGYLINYDIDCEEIESYKEVSDGFFNGFYYLKMKNKNVFKYYHMGKVLNSITIY